VYGKAIFLPGRNRYKNAISNFHRCYAKFSAKLRAE
jgi:hypothetical protein